MAQPLETGAREEQEDKHCVVSVDLFGLRNLLIDSGGDSLGCDWQQKDGSNLRRLDFYFSLWGSLREG
ncbi:hypothetical protein OPV22_028596 [Ensete ventricosum]|uniref:Uncharacterized protein n=1 Tax=Ensete ventricosum TaxID=4639 RepID=A0AAV8QB12_ENSVE|nr:hypothetical protein OPV22_028596 [Ensete ventricosum]